MSATAVGLVMAGLLVIEVWITTRYVRRHAVPADLTITEEECERAAVNASDFLTDLTRSQRLQVSRAVRRGRSVADPVLAPAATSAAYAARLRSRISVARPQWLAASAVVFWGSTAAGRSVDDRGFWQVMNVIVAVGSGWLVHETVVGPLRRAERALRAERSNLALVARVSSVGPKRE